MISAPRIWLCLILAITGTEVAAQTRGGARDTVEAPGAHYRASAIHRFFLGREYRELWVASITLPFLDLQKFAGGLRPVSKGGGQQTKSLLLAAPDGRESARW